MLFDQKKIREVRENVQTYLYEGLLKRDASAKELVNIYLQNAERSFATAKLLLAISDSQELKKVNKLEPDFESYLWILVSSYYSMFYAANALLAKEGLKTSDKIQHKVASDALFFYFILNDKLAKSLYASYEETKRQVMDLIQQDFEVFREKAKRLAISFEYEREKRGTFQYNMKLEMKRSKAVTSLERAREFLIETRALIKS